ncbi:four helix bundle protein [Pontiella sp.]|uniref:four helix bundle protein n=1 Tax=Pontiella sp. TaxID=2837462 RepID=UPI003563B98E
MKIERFEDIDGWKKGRELARLVYSFSRRAEFSKDDGLKDQITRASVSIMNNVAEGFDGGSDAEFIRFLICAQRSITEVKSCLYVALDNEYIGEDDFNKAYSLANEANYLIGGFIKYLKSKRG